MPRADDQSARRLLAKTRSVAHGGLTPRRLGRHSGRRLTFTTTVRMVSRVHDHATDFGPLAHVPCASCLAQALVLVLEIRDLADSRHTAEGDPPDLAGRKSHGGEISLFGEQLGRHARGPDDLTALARDQLDVVDRGAERDVGQRKRIAETSLGLDAGDDHVANLETVGQEHVALLAVLVVEQADTGRPVGVVLDRGQLRRDIELVPLEVQDSVVLLLTAATMTNGELALVIAAGAALLWLKKRLVGFFGRDFLERGPGHAPESRRGWLVAAQRHLRRPRRTRSSGRGPESRLPCEWESCDRPPGFDASRRAFPWTWSSARSRR